MQKCPLPYIEMTNCLHLGKKESSIGRTSLGRTSAATIRQILRWKSITSSGSTSPMASGKSIRIYASGIWQASATSTPQRYQRTTRYLTLASSNNAPSPNVRRLTARPQTKKLITWSMYWTKQSRIPTRSSRSVQVRKGSKDMVK